MTPETKNAVYCGTFAKVWFHDIEAMRKIVKRDYPDGTVFSALIFAPNAHPLWAWYLLALQHLRPISGAPKPKIYRDGATHELLLIACDPKWKPNLLEVPPLLHPINYATQFILTDDEAIETGKEISQKIAMGHLNPDTDGGAEWRRLYGDWMFKSRIARNQ
jgi:hypothetical protein